MAVDAETRREIARRAKEIIQHEPTIGKERVNAFLRAEFGVGLRSASVLKLKAEVAKERPELRYRLYERGSVPIAWRDAYSRLRDAGFLKWEAREFASQYTSVEFRRLSYIIKMVRWRRLYVDHLFWRGYNAKAIESIIIGLYHDKDWVTPDGILNPWKMLRSFRQKDIESGEYIPVKKMRRDASGKIISVSKGDVEGQKERWRRRRAERLAGDEVEREKERARRRAEKARAKAREEH